MIGGSITQEVTLTDGRVRYLAIENHGVGIQRTLRTNELERVSKRDFLIAELELNDPLGGLGGDFTGTSEPQNADTVALHKLVHENYAWCLPYLARSPALNLKRDMQLHWVDESTAMAVLDTAELEHVDATLIAVTWAAESGFSDNPINNPRNKNGKEIGADIGPMQMANTIYNKSPFTDNLGDVFGSNQKGGQRFNGTPAANLRAGARALNYALGMAGGADPRAEAAGFYRAGPNRNSDFRRRVQQFNAWSQTYDDFFNCLKRRR